MATIRTSQNSFSGGEFSPGLYGRTEVAKYGSGCKKALNFLLHPHGPASNRPGLRFMATSWAKAGTTPRLVEFGQADGESYILEIGETLNVLTGLTVAQYIRFFTNDGLVKVSSAPAWVTGTQYEVASYVTFGGVIYRSKASHTAAAAFATDLAAGRWVADDTYVVYPGPAGFGPFPADLSTLKVAQSADVLFFTRGDKPHFTLSRYGHTDWRIGEMNVLNTVETYDEWPFLAPNIMSTELSFDDLISGEITASVAFFESSHENTMLLVRHQVTGSTIAEDFTAVGATASIPVISNWRIKTSGDWRGSFQVQYSDDGESTWKTLDTFESANYTDFDPAADVNFDTSGDIDNPRSYAFKLRVNVANITHGTLTVHLSSEGGEVRSIILIGTVNNATSADFTAITPLGSITGTKDFAECAWSDRHGYPNTIAFYQDRLVLGRGQTVWFSESGKYRSFARSVPLVDSDGITVDLPSRKLNSIVDLVPATRLTVLTTGTPFTIRPGSDGGLAPTSIIVEPAGQSAAAKVDAVLIASKVIFIQPQGSKVKGIGYSFQTDSYEPVTLSTYANHLFRRYGVVDMAYQEEQDSILWCVRSDGRLLGLTYDPAEEVLAWSQHETDGEFLSVATIPGDGYNEVWFIVDRDGTMTVEKLTNRMPKADIRQAFFVDSGVTIDNPKTITGITQASPAVVTSAAHGFSNGDLVDVSDVAGMIAVNGRRFKVAGATTNTFQLKDPDTNDNVDSTSFAAYKSGGEVRKTFSSVSGLSHLEGRKVSILADGKWLGSNFTVTTGAVTLTRPASIVHVGLPYVGEAVTLRFESPRRDGPMLGTQTQVPSVTALLEESVGGEIGIEGGSLTPIQYPRGAENDLFTGMAKTTVSGGYSKEPCIVVRQEAPLPITLLSLTPDMAFGGAA